MTAQEELKLFEQGPEMALAAEVERATPWWTPLLFGMPGPALVLWKHTGGWYRWSGVLTLVVLYVGILVIFRVRLQRRVRPRPARWKSLKSSPIYALGIRELLRINLVPTALLTATLVLVEIDVTLWFLLPASYCAIAVTVLMTIRAGENMQQRQQSMVKADESR